MTDPGGQRPLRRCITAAVLPWIELIRARRPLWAIALLTYEAMTAFLVARAVGRLSTPALFDGPPREILWSLIGLAAVSLLLRGIVAAAAWRTGPAADRPGGSRRSISRRISADPKGVAGLLVLAALSYIALAAPLLAGDPLVMTFPDALRPPSRLYLLGTDMYGRDIFSRIVYGARYTLGIGVTATLLNVVLGASLGLLSGFLRGAPDAVIMRILEILNSIPFLMLAILIVALFGSSIPMLIVVLSVFVLQPARIVRGQVLELREKGFVQAALALGASRSRVVLTHVLPNVTSTLLVVTSVRVGQNILSLAGLSFLGMGITPPTPSWGSMLQEGRAYIQNAPWLGAFPGAAIFLTVLAFNLLGDSLRDALDPRLGRR